MFVSNLLRDGAPIVAAVQRADRIINEKREFFLKELL